MKSPLIARSLATAAVLAAGSSAWAGVSNLDENLPTEIEDARPVDTGEKEFQLPLRWEREKSGRNRFVYEPQLQWGFAEGWQGSVSVRGFGGSASHINSGDLRVKLMRQFAKERAVLPALAAFLEVDVPTGQRSRGVDPGLRLVATKTLSARPNTHQVHFNALWIRNNAPLPDAHGRRVRLLAGYSTPLAERTVLVADVIRQHERERGQMSTIAEVGLRQEVARRTMVSFAVGSGRGGESAPRWRLHAAFERAF